MNPHTRVIRELRAKADSHRTRAKHPFMGPIDRAACTADATEYDAAANALEQLTPQSPTKTNQTQPKRT